MAAPLVNRIYEEMKGEGVELVKISTTAEREQLAKYVSEHPELGGVFLHDPAPEETAVGYAKYQITGFPSFITIDRKGRVSGVWKHYKEGPSEVKIRAMLSRALTGK